MRLKHERLSKIKPYWIADDYPDLTEVSKFRNEFAKQVTLEKEARHQTNEVVEQLKLTITSINSEGLVIVKSNVKMRVPKWQQTAGHLMELQGINLARDMLLI